MPEMITCPMCQRSIPADTVHTCPGVPVHVGHWTVSASDTKETFPRPPSNEQTLLTELGTWKELHRLAKHAIVNHGYFKPSEVGDDLAPRITEMLMAIEADRDEARRQLAEIKEIDAKMCADYSTMVEQLAEAREWIKRLSESLVWAVDVIEGNLDRKKYFGPERVNAARAILKETAP